MPISRGIISWIIYFISPYRSALRGYFIYRFIRYTYFALLPAVISIYVDKLQNGEFKNNPEFFATIGFVYLFFYALMLLVSNFILNLKTNILIRALA